MEQKPLADLSNYSPVEIHLSNWQSTVFLDDARYKVINCGRRAGKSTVSSLKLLHNATENPKSINWYIAPTYKQAKGIMWEMLLDLIPAPIILRKNETELSIVLINGSRILLKGAENPDSLRGVRIDFCVFDEAAFIDKWEAVWKVVRPTLADTKADCWFISTPNGFNHFKDMYDTQRDGWKSFHYTTYDNPFIPKEEIELAKQEMNEDSFQQEWLGEFRKMSGLIYKQFGRDTHMVDCPAFDHNWTFTRAIDFGFGHKTALGYFAINSTGTEIYCYDGMYQSGLTTKDMAEAIKVKDAGRVITNPVADSAQPMFIEELAREGVHFNPVVKGEDSVKNGIVKLSELLKLRADTGKPTLMFSKHLTWIADEFENYRWMETGNGTTKEVPLKRDDDAVDMIRYFGMSYKQERREYKQPSRPRLTYGR
jgi:PBSX family phage terminase large subunit